MPLTASGVRLLLRQLQELTQKPLGDIYVQPSEDITELRCIIDGPVDTPFNGGRFQVSLLFDEHYPEAPPKGIFRTRIFHPNVSERGDICVNALKKDWSPALGLRHILLVIRCLMIEPNPESALNDDAGRLLLEDYDAYRRKAAMLTGVYAGAHGHDGADASKHYHGGHAATSSSGATAATRDDFVGTENGKTDLINMSTHATGANPAGLRDIRCNVYNNNSHNDGYSKNVCDGACNNEHDGVVGSQTSNSGKAKKKRLEEKRKNALRRI